MMADSAVAMPEAEQCAFCDYLSGARPYVFLWRDDDVAVAVTLEQRGVAHLIVFPTEHVHNILELPTELAAPLMIALRDAASAIDLSEHRPGIAIWQNNGQSAGQKINHLHFHVAGTLPSGGTAFGKVPEISMAEAATIARRLAPHVSVRGDAAKRRLFT